MAISDIRQLGLFFQHIFEITWATLPCPSCPKCPSLRASGGGHLPQNLPCPPASPATTHLSASWLAETLWPQRPHWLPIGWCWEAAREAMPLAEAGMQGGEASLVSVVHQRPQQEAMLGAKSSGGKVGLRITLYFANPQWIVSQPIESERSNKKAIGFSLPFLALV